MAFDLGAGDGTQVQVVVATEEALNLRILGGDTVESAEPAALIAAWSRATGLPRLPPTWAGAPFLWRNVNVDDAEVLADAAAIREHDLAFGVLWVDNPWQSSYNSMQPDPAQFADWAGMVSVGGYSFGNARYNLPSGADVVPYFGGVYTRLDMTIMNNWDFSLQANNDSYFDWTGLARITYRMGGSRRRTVSDQLEQPMMRNEHIVRAHQTPQVAVNETTGTPWRVFVVNNAAASKGYEHGRRLKNSRRHPPKPSLNGRWVRKLRN
jgi:hypothetical protein